MACIVGAIGIWIAISFERKNVPIKSINSYLIVAINYIVNALLVFGMATFLGPVVQTLFNKDLTFSNRTNAWIAAFSGFLKNPIFSISIEMLQLLLRLGTFQLSDIFYNTVGGVLGGLIYYGILDGIVKARKHL